MLVRHGKAEDLQAGKTDDDRALTMEGIEELEENVPYLAHIFKKKKKVEIWCSPLVRAMQTAEILAKYIKTDGIQVHRFILDGDLDRLLSMMAKRENADCIIAVGHEPTMSLWTRRLTGQARTFKKGAAKMISVDFDNVYNCTLRWEANAKDFSNLPEAQQWMKRKSKKVVRDLSDEIQDNILGKLDQFLQRPEKPKSVHRLRVNLYRMRSLMAFIKPITEKNAWMKSNRLYRSFRRDVEVLRELDVIVAELSQTPESAQKYAHLIDTLQKLRQESTDSVLQKADHDDIDKLYDEAYRRLLKAVNKSDDDSRWKEFATKRLDDWYEQFEEMYRNLDWTDIEEVHDLRLRCKRYQYVCKLVDGTLPLVTDERYDLTLLLHAELGKLCDCDANKNLLERMIPDNGDADLMKERDAFVEELNQAQKELEVILEQQRNEYFSQTEPEVR